MANQYKWNTETNLLRLKGLGDIGNHKHHKLAEAMDELGQLAKRESKKKLKPDQFIDLREVRSVLTKINTLANINEDSIVKDNCISYYELLSKQLAKEGSTYELPSSLKNSNFVIKFIDKLLGAIPSAPKLFEEFASPLFLLLGLCLQLFSSAIAQGDEIISTFLTSLKSINWSGLSFFFDSRLAS